MRTAGLWAALIAAMMLAGPAFALDGGRYGEVKLAEPVGPMRGFVILFSDRGGWAAPDEAAAQALAKAGALVVEVDTDAYVARLDKVDEPCHWPEGDAEGLSWRLQRQRGSASYATPILAGRGQGGVLAWMALAEAPAATIAGAVTLDVSPGLPTKRPLCADHTPATTPQGYVYGAPKTLPGFWTAGFSAKGGREPVEALKKAGVPVEIREGADIAALTVPHLVQPKPSRNDLSALHLVELSAAAPSSVMAVVLSGDGGWRDLDKAIAEHLQKGGVPVVGWDTLRYFWSKKTPEQTSSDLAAVLDAYMGKWHATDVVLIGYSFGAGVLPFAYNRLPPPLRAHVVEMSLLGFEDRADFEASPTGWLGAPPSTQALPVAPEMARVPAKLVQCFYGAEEKDSACPGLAARGMEVIRTGGGHHFDGDYGALAEKILTGLKRRQE